MTRNHFISKYITIICISVLCLISLNSCGIYKKYHREEINTNNLYGNMPVETDTTSSIAALGWKELFTDKHLQNLIEDALESNVDLKIAHLKVQEAQVSLNTAKLAYLPSLQINPEVSISNNTKKNYSLGMSASWEIDLLGKLTNAKRRELAVLEQSKAYRQAVQVQLISTVAESYYTLLLLDEQIRITNETIESWNEYVHSLEALMKAGQADRATVSQARASRLDAESSLLALQQQVSEVENSICSLLFKEPGKIERGKLDEQKFPESLSVGVSFELLSMRPDIMQAEAELKQAYYVTNEARSAFYPSITLGGTAGWSNNTGTVISNPGTWLFQAIGSLVQPLFNRGKNIANLKISKMQQEEALLKFKQSLLDAGKEVNNAVTLWQTARKQIDIENEQVDNLSTTVHDTQLLMQHGTTNYIEVLTARQSLLTTELSLVANRNNEIQSIIKLYHALGGGINT